MTALPLPVPFLASWIGTWIARHQEHTIEYLKEENRVLREKGSHSRSPARTTATLGNGRPSR